MIKNVNVAFISTTVPLLGDRNQSTSPINSMMHKIHVTGIYQVSSYHTVNSLHYTDHLFKTVNANYFCLVSESHKTQIYILVAKCRLFT